MGSPFPSCTAGGRTCALVGMRKPTYSIHGKELYIKDMLTPGDMQPKNPYGKVSSDMSIKVQERAKVELD